MAHRRLIRLAAGLLVLAACGEPPRPPPKDVATASAKHAVAYPTDDKSWGKFHSKRFQLTVPLPDGHAWRIDDHKHQELFAEHPPTSSRLVLVTTDEQELMNRQRCQERAEKIGWLPKGPLTTVDDQTTVGPEAFDSRIWTALSVDGAVTGHVYLFGAFIRRCLLVHLTTSIAAGGPEDEKILADRLAIATARIVKGITLDPPRTTDDATVPRQKPEIAH